MILRRVGFVSVSLTEILRRSQRCCSTSSSSSPSSTTTITSTTTSTRSSAATTLWSVSSTATREKSLASVEDMFGQVEGDENSTTAPLTSSTHLVDETLFDWEDDISSSNAAESGRDLCLESVMNAALGEIHTNDDLNSVKAFNKPSSQSGNRTPHMTHSENIVVDRGDDDNDNNDNNMEDDSESTDNNNNINDININDRGGGGGMTSKLDAVNVEFDNDEEDASSLVTEEEEEEVERLLRATQTSESTSALFFKDRTQTNNSAKTKIKIKTSAFDDAAAEGAELESVGEVMPSPQRV